MTTPKAREIRLPPLNLAISAIAKIEDAAIPQNTRTQKSKSAPEHYRVLTTPSRPKTRPLTHTKNLVDDQDDGKPGIRVDSAGLFEKLAEIIPHPSTKYQFDKSRHRKIMDAVASCTSIREAPGLEYHVHKIFPDKRRPKRRWQDSLESTSGN
jgi:hypothetical protein